MKELLNLGVKTGYKHWYCILLMIQWRAEYLLAGMEVAMTNMKRTIYMTRTVLKECLELPNSQLLLVRNVSFLLYYIYNFFL